MADHEWGCDVDRAQQYGEPLRPRCTWGQQERSLAERRVAEVEEIWDQQARVIRNHARIIEEQGEAIRNQSRRIGEIAAANFGLRKARDEAREEAARLRGLIEGIARARGSGQDDGEKYRSIQDLVNQLGETLTTTRRDDLGDLATDEERARVEPHHVPTRNEG